MRICITGGPRTGKTTLSHGYPLFSSAGVAKVRCDEFIDTMNWSEASAHIATLIAQPGPYIIEGVQVARALRKLDLKRRTTKPCDRLIILRNEPFEPWNAGRARMAKGLDTVLDEILPDLRRLGVEVEERR